MCGVTWPYSLSTRVHKYESADPRSTGLLTGLCVPGALGPCGDIPRRKVAQVHVPARYGASYKGVYIYDWENARYVDFACVTVKMPVMGDGYTYGATQT